MTKSTGIIMSGDHPVKCLNGTKTVTRRTWGLEKINKDPDKWILLGRYPDGYGDRWRFRRHGTDEEVIIKCPYGGVGDLLWMKETHQWVTLAGKDPWKDKAIADGTFRRMPDGSPVKMCYRADGYEIGANWRPSIHTPRWASRADLEILPGLRPERLQAITEEDALAEGITVMQGTWQALGRGEGGKLEPVGEPHPFTARYHFGALWDNLNAHRGYPWDGNHWIWRIPFKLQG